MQSLIAASATGSCPKRMVYGPCGGVRDDGGCELEPMPCSFAELQQAIPFVGPGPNPVGERDLPDRPVRTSTLLSAAQRAPVVLTDLTVRPFDPASIGEVAARLQGSCDAVLVGEHQNRPDFPPVMLADLINQAGLRAWVTLTCRDRNRIVLEQEVAGLLRTDVDGVLCVTGDGRAQGVRPGVTQVFDLDGTRLAALASAAGLPTAVAESPQAQPIAIRPARLRQKQSAGADLAILNHVSSSQVLEGFLTRAQRGGVTIPLIAAVAVYTDRRSVAVLENFPGLNVDPARMRAVLASPDPIRAGIDEAVREARGLLAIPGVAGVNLSGLASADGELVAAEIKAEIGHRIRAELRSQG